jgi:DNA-binding transcriptional LysR family regulator
VGPLARLTRLDEGVARRWPGLFRADERRRYQVMIAYQAIVAVVLFVAAGTGIWALLIGAVYPVLATLTELVRLMPEQEKPGG